MKSSRRFLRIFATWFACALLCAVWPVATLRAACPNGMCCPGGVCRPPGLGLGGATPLGGPALGAAQNNPLGQYNAGGQTPHPAVVRVIAVDRDGMSLGSGTLIYATDRHGLVITNWHVVRDAVGAIEVVFPGGYHSAGTVIKVDNNWDLAAIGIWKPPVAAVELATVPPQQGEPLTIAGYGPGPYRAATGRCMQYVSPGGNHPFQIIELSAEARQGDSGGPIFNARGQLAGVLLGAGGGVTVGSYCGRVGMFLADVTPLLDQQRTDGRHEMLASAAATDGGAAAGFARRTTPPTGDVSSSNRPSAWRGGAEETGAVRPDAPAAVAAVAASADRAESATARSPWSSNLSADALDLGRTSQADTAQWSGGPPPRRALAPAAMGNPESVIRWNDVVGNTRGEQAKSLLAAIGAISILLLSIRVLVRG